MFQVEFTSIEIPAIAAPPEITGYSEAWRVSYRTVRLTEDIPAVRVHGGAGSGAAADFRRAWGSGLSGRWFAIGDVAFSKSEYQDQYALPSAFRLASLCRLKVGSVLNVGVAAALFGQRGGGVQAEWRSGPEPERQAIGGLWADTAGSA